LIFVTVGSNEPFDRLVKAMDEWSAELGYGDIFGQIGEGRYEPTHFPFVRTLTPHAYHDKLDAATIVVSHVGSGTIIGAVHSGKPMVLLPRRVDYHEVRNSHQLDSAHRLIGQPGIFIADQTADLPACIADALMAPALELAPNDHLTSLISRLRQFIEFEPAD
jgi:UDP-N-acetylglucosamine transferase subunit ALG13